jgi:Adenylate and Guanylate cyclase catalytic domain
LCGIVGTKRVKFDVWSNDVSFASKMESTGHPDLVHISEETKSFLKDSFNYREAEEVDGHKTFFILGRKDQTRKFQDHKLLEVQQNYENSTKLEWQTKKLKNLSTNDIPSIPATSPTQTVHVQSKSLSPSPILNTRKRLASISETVSRLLSSASGPNRSTNEQNKVLLERKTPNPKIIIGISEVSVADEQQINDDKAKANYIKSKKDCDKTTEKIVPYNGIQDELPVKNETSLNLLPQIQKTDDDGDNSSINITDLRSYISQSRCDVSPFSRNGSRRSDRHHYRSYSQQSNSLSPWYQAQQLSDGTSLSPSRKDSGFKTNSRRSSIQPQSYYKQLLTAPSRVSGYFTSSQSSLSPGNGNTTDNIMLQHLPSPASGDVPKPRGDTLKACVQHLRKQSDLQLIRCVRDNARSQRSYLVKPPIRKFSLSFESSIMEKTFRNKAHRYELDEEATTPIYTLATPKFNTFIDVSVLFIIFGMVALSLFLLSPTYTKESKVWVCCFVSFSSAIFTILFLCSKQICRRPGKSAHFNSIFGWASNFFPWNFFGSILISLPAVSILINFALVDIHKFPSLHFYYGLLLFVSLIHFCNFIQLNCWAKNCLATVASALFVIIAFNNRGISQPSIGFPQKMMKNATQINLTDEWLTYYESELCLDLILVLILVFLLNREFEVGYRLSFYGNEVANMDKVRVQNMKNQADLLLHNIIPKHVAEELKNTAKYSKNHQDCGIIFASIVNFTEMYDESYLGGKEYLRVLNELIGGRSSIN